MYTLENYRMSPKNGLFQYGIHLPTIDFQGIYQLLISSHEFQVKPINPQGNPQRIPQTPSFQVKIREFSGPHSSPRPFHLLTIGRSTTWARDVPTCQLLEMLFFYIAKHVGCFFCLDGEENFGRLFGTS